MSIFVKNNILCLLSVSDFPYNVFVSTTRAFESIGGKNHFSAQVAAGPAATFSPQDVGYSSTNSASRIDAAPPCAHPPCGDAANNPRCPVTMALRAHRSRLRTSWGMVLAKAVDYGDGVAAVPSSPGLRLLQLESPHLRPPSQPFLQLRSCLLKRLGFTLWLLIYSLSSSSPDFIRSG